MPKTKLKPKPADNAGKTSLLLTALTGRPAGLTEKIKELIRLAQEQGNLTFNDIYEVLTPEQSTPEQLDEVLAKLRELEIEIVDPAEVDGKADEDEELESRHLDAL